MYEQYAVCKDCRQGFFYRRPAYHGRIRCICDKCRDDHRKKGTRNRVAKHRAHKPERMNGLTIHITKSENRTYCGRKVDKHTMAALGKYIAEHPKAKHKYCATCIKAFARDEMVRSGK